MIETSGIETHVDTIIDHFAFALETNGNKIYSLLSRIEIKLICIYI